jgi:hypothetical protein
MRGQGIYVETIIRAPLDEVWAARFLFGYRGSFTCEWMPAADAPPHVIPRRHESRV